jgi:hypothetical protein
MLERVRAAAARPVDGFRREAGLIAAIQKREFLRFKLLENWRNFRRDE